MGMGRVTGGGEKVLVAICLLLVQISLEDTIDNAAECVQRGY